MQLLNQAGNVIHGYKGENTLTFSFEGGIGKHNDSFVEEGVQMCILPIVKMLPAFGQCIIFLSKLILALFLKNGMNLNQYPLLKPLLGWDIL